MINIVIPMAGLGKRFSSAGFTKPKPFIPLNNSTMIEHVLKNLKYDNANYFLIARKEHIDAEQILVKEIEKNYNAKFISINNLTEGSACTVLFARKYINNDMPLLIANSDQIIDITINNFINDSNNRELDGSIICFEDLNLDPKWSFAKINSNNLVQEVKEKIPISKYATVGVYFFKKGRYFVENALDMIISNDRVNNEFYTCPVYNYLIKSNKKIGIFLIDYSQMHGLGTPEDYFLYLNRINDKK